MAIPQYGTAEFTTAVDAAFVDLKSQFRAAAEKFGKPWPPDFGEDAALHNAWVRIKKAEQAARGVRSVADGGVKAAEQYNSADLKAAFDRLDELLEAAYRVELSEKYSEAKLNITFARSDLNAALNLTL